MAESDLDYAKATGRFGRLGADTDDEGDNPDIIWCDEGEIDLIPLTTVEKVAGGTPVPFEAGQSTFTATISGVDYVDPTGGVRNGPGHLIFRDKPFIMLVDLTSEKVNPRIGEGKATHRVVFRNLRADGVRVDFPARTVRITKDGPNGDGENDLVQLLPLVVGDGTPITIGPAGPAGGPGPTGDVTPEALAAKEAAETAQGLAETARDDAEAAEATATEKATEAGLSASTADTAKTEAEAARDAAQGHASTANTKAGEAAASADSIVGDRAAAEAAADTATTKAGEAVAARDAAEGHKNAAHQSALDAAASAQEAAAGGVQKVLGISPDVNGNVDFTAANVPGAATASDITTASTADRARANHTGTQSLDTTTDSGTRVAMTPAERTKLGNVATNATANDTDANLKARANHTGTQSLDTTTDSATRLAMTAAERTKLGGVATNATANSADATLLARGNHTGTQAASTITGLAAVATSGAYSSLSGTPSLGDAAAKNTGTAAGTVAAGNDSRIVNAARKEVHVTGLATTGTVTIDASNGDGLYESATLTGDVTLSVTSVPGTGTFIFEWATTQHASAAKTITVSIQPMNETSATFTPAVGKAVSVFVEYASGTVKRAWTSVAK